MAEKENLIAYRSYKPNTSIGFYTNKTCDLINIDPLSASRTHTRAVRLAGAILKNNPLPMIDLIMCRHAAV